MGFWFEIVVIALFVIYVNKFTENLFIDEK